MWTNNLPGRQSHISLLHGSRLKPACDSNDPLLLSSELLQWVSWEKNFFWEVLLVVALLEEAIVSTGIFSSFSLEKRLNIALFTQVDRAMQIFSSSVLGEASQMRFFAVVFRISSKTP